MNRKERSRSRSASGIRQHKKQSKVLIKKDKNYDSSSDIDFTVKFGIGLFIQKYKRIRSFWFSDNGCSDIS